LLLGSAAVIAVYGAGFERTRAAAAQLEGESQSRQRPREPDAPPSATAVVTAAVESTSVATASAVVVPAASPAPPVTAKKTTPTSDTAVATQATAVDTAVAQATAQVATQTATQTTTDTTAAKVARWHDGTFKGWGNSRHGSIEATIVIVDGRITEAYISECRTRYSCSWVEHLPAQVVARQSQEVDYVSGATQSANAFYYAVGEALTKAK
jgi:uncharacterized protein with FMN-binding domain